MQSFDPLWIPSSDRPALPVPPDLLESIRSIHIDNTRWGQVAPGHRDVRFNGSPVPYRDGKGWQQGATFLVGATSTVVRNEAPGEPRRSTWTRIEIAIGGVPRGGAGVIVPDDQLGTAIDLLVDNLATDKGSGNGVLEWSLVAAQVHGVARFGLWFCGGPLHHSGVPRFRNLVGLVAASVDVEFAFDFHEDEREPETCTIWGPDGRLVGRLDGGVFLECTRNLGEVRSFVKERIQGRLDSGSEDAR